MNSGKNAANLDIYTLTEGTGIFAGNTYEFSIDGTTAVEDADYTVESKGDEIPNGDMSAWSNNDRDVTAPNAAGESFWDSGNNTISSSLCTNEEGKAHLKPYSVDLSFIGIKAFACGNLYTGNFTMSGTEGTASFGQKYNWTARPTSLKVSFKAKVGNIDFVGDSDDASLNGKQDTTRIYAVVIDWTKQHEVISGMTTPSGMWDPSTKISLDEGAILDITANQDTFTDAEIPFVWYDTVTKPAEGNYSVVISCATSKRGDYLTGCSTNELWVDNFAWGY